MNRVLRIIALLAVGAGPGAGAGDGPPRRWREPVALASGPGGAWLYAANRAGGSISVIDVEGRRAAAEWAVGGAPADLTATADGRHLLVADELGDRVVLLAVDGLQYERKGAVEVAPGPIGVALTPNGRRAVVASLWPRRLTVLDLAADGSGLTVAGGLDLPFEPRCVCVIDANHAVIADAFGGRIGVVDVAARSLESVRELPVHNIRGLALSGDGRRLLVTHQALSRSARAEFNDIHWGSLLSNSVRALPLPALLDPKADPVRAGTLYQLGDAGEGSGDPNGLAVLGGGRVAVALGGVDRLALGTEGEPAARRLAVGRRPVALAVVDGGSAVAVANAFGDSVSIVPLGKGSETIEISLGRRPEEPDAARRGRLLFYDARASHDGWLSCHSCHTDGHTSGRLADTLGDGTYGTPKRTPSLLGVGATGPWAWDGSIHELGDQVRRSFHSTMQGPEPAEAQVAAVAAFLRTLEPPPALAVDAAQAARGEALFGRLGCAGCHAPPHYTNAKTYDVGLADEAGRRRFNPPSLRGVGRRSRLFHDGRAASLAEVVERFRHQLDGPLSDGDRDDLLAFLRGL